MSFRLAQTRTVPCRFLECGGLRAYAPDAAAFCFSVPRATCISVPRAAAPCACTGHSKRNCWCRVRCSFTFTAPPCMSVRLVPTGLALISPCCVPAPTCVGSTSVAHNDSDVTASAQQGAIRASLHLTRSQAPHLLHQGLQLPQGARNQDHALPTPTPPHPTPNPHLTHPNPHLTHLLHQRP